MPQIPVSIWTTRTVEGDETDLLLEAVADFSPGKGGDDPLVELHEIYLEEVDMELSVNDLTQSEIDRLVGEALERVGYCG